MSDATARMAAIAKQALELHALANPEPRSETIAEAVDEYIAAKAGRNKPKTEENRTYYLGRFTDAIGELPLADLCAEDSQLWLDSFPVGSRHNVRTVLSPFLTWASQNGWPDAAAAKPFAFRRGSQERDRYLTYEEFSRIATALSVYSKRPRAHAVTVDALWLSLTTPFRSGEVVTLVAGEVSPMGDYIFLRDAKTGDRKVWLGPRAQEIVRRRRSQATQSGGRFKHLFPGRTQSHLQQTSLSHAWRKLADSVGLNDVWLHDLRRTWASLALDSGEKMGALRISLGHTTEHMTARYAHLGDDRMEDVATRVERLLLGSLQYQLELRIPEPKSVTLDQLTPAQFSLLCCPGSEVFPRGAGQAQAAKALVRRGLFVELRQGAYERTPDGEELRGVSNVW
ncbi:MAG: tyrosine-type recombinase/integrase [Nannocystales bacterium]